ncbi:MAG: DUF1461 domain-containing protein [Clostridia bacterium]|nr:DUF1461 domain-containing protein [Clostridia bacterium]
MRNTIGKLCVIIATIVLLFSAGFFTVSLILKDNDAIEKQYRELDVSSQVGISTPDLARATTAILDYMRGDRVNIKVEAKINGEDVKDVFWHEKEIVHMAEVQTLWLGMEAFTKVGALGASALLLIGFLLIERGKKRAILASGIFWGCGVFGGVLAFLGIWAILDFSSFWTVFHFIIFPSSLFQYLSAGATVQAMNELNWVLPSDSVMVNMLLPIFPSIVLRCALAVIIEIVVAAIVAVFIGYAFRKQGKPSPVADVVVIEHDANEPVAIKGPDLVLAHTLQNAPVSKREEIRRRALYGEAEEEKPSTPVAEHLIPPLYPKEETDATTLSSSPDGKDTSPCTGEARRDGTPSDAAEPEKTIGEHAPVSQPPSDEGGVSQRLTEGETTSDGETTAEEHA